MKTKRPPQTDRTSVRIPCSKAERDAWAVAAKRSERTLNGWIRETLRKEMTMRAHRDDTHTRTENMALVTEIVGRRTWEDDPDTTGGIVTAYAFDDGRINLDARRLKDHGFWVSVSTDGADVKPRRSYLWVVVGE